MDVYGGLPFDNMHDWTGWSYQANWNSYECQKALAKALGKFNSLIGPSAGLGIDAAEHGQALKMIEKRGLMLLRFVRALKKGRFNDAWKAIRDRVPREPPKGLHRAKGFANNFLEWHFGWSPLISDIYHAIEVLQSPISTLWVRARSTYKLPIQYTVFRDDQVVFSAETITQLYRIELGAGIYVSNPNLRLATQLGVVNPAALAWEVVPFSFLVDWFVPVGNFLSQWTDHLGLTLQGAYTTSTWYTEYHSSYVVHMPYGNRNDQRHKYRFTMKRALGISNYRLTANHFSGLTPMRGATAIALLLQSLRSQ
jgi:hypothetical protein